MFYLLGFSRLFRRFGAILALIGLVSVAVTACGKRAPLPDNSSQLGLGNYAPGSEQEFSALIGNRVLFETDSSSLDDEARIILDGQAQWLAQYGQHDVLIEGHADERGTREYNLALGARRATAARDYLVSKGVSAARLKTISFGKERPIAVCNDVSCWSQNRRAVSVLNAAGL